MARDASWKPSLQSLRHNMVIVLETFMLTSARKIGHSRGVLIPAAHLSSCRIGEQVDMQLQDGKIVYKPAPTT